MSVLALSLTRSEKSKSEAWMRFRVESAEEEGRARPLPFSELVHRRVVMVTRGPGANLGRGGSTGELCMPPKRSIVDSPSVQKDAGGNYSGGSRLISSSYFLKG
ncbi:hypothetical protein Rs2_18422 [Raphanus sativus]|nr:hypothetical protein Rs2_18422 [Raphanus sativus]